MRRTVGEVVVEVDYETRRVTTFFPDGELLVACPNLDDASIQLARELGYEGGDEDVVWAMTVDHDFAHSLVAHGEGKRWSHTLHAVAAGEPIDSAEGHREECLALLLQRVSNRGLAKAAA